MKIGFKCFLVFSMFFLFPFVGIGQNQNIANLNPEKPKEFKLISPLDLVFKLPKSGTTNTIKQRSIFDVDKLPIFCKFEHKLSKSSKVNVRMRLGSLDYVNKLEGKN